MFDPGSREEDADGDEIGRSEGSGSDRTASAKQDVRLARRKCVQSLRKPRSGAIGDEMKGKRFTEEQVIGIPNGAEQSRNIREACRRNNITETTFYRCRTKFGGMGVSDSQRLRELEQENSQLELAGMPARFVDLGHDDVDTGRGVAPRVLDRAGEGGDLDAPGAALLDHPGRRRAEGAGDQLDLVLEEHLDHFALLVETDRHLAAEVDVFRERGDLVAGEELLDEAAVFGGNPRVELARVEAARLVAADELGGQQQVDAVGLVADLLLDPGSSGSAVRVNASASRGSGSRQSSTTKQPTIRCGRPGDKQLKRALDHRSQTASREERSTTIAEQID